MKIEGAEITINQSSILSLEPPDSIQHCFIKIKKSESGVDHPITIKSGPDLVFQFNRIESEIPGPILLDGEAWPGVGDNYFHLAEVPN